MIKITKLANKGIRACSWSYFFIKLLPLLAGAIIFSILQYNGGEVRDYFISEIGTSFVVGFYFFVFLLIVQVLLFIGLMVGIGIEAEKAEENKDVN